MNKIYAWPICLAVSLIGWTVFALSLTEYDQKHNWAHGLLFGFGLAFGILGGLATLWTAAGDDDNNHADLLWVSKKYQHFGDW